MTHRGVPTTNLSKVYWPESATTKGDLINYYREIAPVMVPLVKDRAMTLLRCPDGVDGEHFFTKNAPKSHPKWLRTVDIWAESSERIVHYPLIDSADALVWAANLGTIEFHVSPARSEALDSPLYLVFDLDPGEPAGASDCARVAVDIRERVGTDGLKALVKSSGSKGIHVLIPLNSGATFEVAAAYAKRVATDLERSDPSRITTKMKRDLRGGKVFIDWSQNQRHKTTVAPYSVRARRRPLVSLPLTWGEVSDAAQSGRSEELFVEIDEVVRRTSASGSGAGEFSRLMALRQELPNIETEGAGGIGA